MRFTNNLSRMTRVVGAVILTAAAALTIGAAPAEARPPDHARAYGYRARHDDHHRDRWRNRHDRDRRHRRHHRDRHRYYRYDRGRYYRHDRDRRYTPYRYNRYDYWLDWDGDGIPNSRDRYPRNRRRH